MEDIIDEIVSKGIRDDKVIDEISSFAIQLVENEAYLVAEAVAIAIKEQEFNRK
ncbi:hypothetical protein L5F43_03735 [Aliarcobacter butzleri]|nr:hypothetical protein [Aliarcobacter butzleri]MCG3655375.1 hypothetical protein [Aliarcobacter butzleri]MCG3684400.1 hypothetical protein [Aliarcobacter butzleri]MCG3685903.1 hypothetical protein [Aliarcobacter butzleri]MCG3705592.1 hypothetical protein [Aliarcobacter butzleri]MCG3710232.1 hypothetical protein [Aliarcobacter butzleri]